MTAPADGSSPDRGIGFLRKVQQFTKHDTVKLGDHNFLLWKQQVMLILEGYGLHEFVLGTVAIPPQSVVDNNGTLVPNPKFLVHKHVSLQANIVQQRGTTDSNTGQSDRAFGLSYKGRGRSSRGRGRGRKFFSQ
ncbi:hypothetical protein J1N35_040303 [Gossypium stocksii]|uniref:Retrotransposon Copia-like N-terminal domain-containing protein n=1 Tax=Gossypium stocksii TaxID=47602 RepID=A0A9D3ZHK5_9ROSI|nr:hypothetical protein J1N35_040303 [Gossypium stocksii]